MQDLINKFVRAKKSATKARRELSKVVLSGTSGLSVEQVIILEAITIEARTVSDIAKRCAMHVPSVSRALADLDGKGIFERLLDGGDMRYCMIKITAHGKNLLAMVYEVHLGLVDKI